MAMPSEAPEQARPAGFAEISRAVVSAAADLVGTVERAVIGDANVRTARGNAWAAICADRARAQARDEMDQLVRALLADGPRTRAAEVATAAGISRASSAAGAESAAHATRTTGSTGAESTGHATAATRSAGAESAERPARAESRAGSGSSSRTRPTTPKRNAGQNQPAAGRRTGRGQRAVGSSPRSGAPQTGWASAGSSSR